MKNLLHKEIKLASLPITYFFTAFGLMAFLPGYPIVTASFFVCMGIFQSFQFARESNDAIYTLLLPIAKTEAVKSKFLFVVFIQLISFIITAVCTMIRMICLPNAEVYLQNPLLPANLFYLGFCLVCFGLFNLVFVRRYFKTAYKIGLPFLYYCLWAAVVISLSETVKHIPGLSFFGTTDFSHIVLQATGLGAGVILFTVMTLLSYKSAVKSFERLDF